ncbi:MAG TPA: chromosomal replication initiator protein DnaA [Ktedonobacterales bacterium]|nr:chromosomal replication initiator protein DnaA [Ktedonobacterales bacterium]
MSNAHVWRAALGRLQREVTGAQLNTWLRGAQLVNVSGGAATVHVRSTFERELIESRYHDLIERALSDVVGAPVALTIATAPGGVLSDRPGAPRGTATASSEAPKATYARPLFLLADEEDGLSAAEAQAPQPLPAPTRNALAGPLQPPRQRIPESPSVNASARDISHRVERRNVTTDTRQTTYGESASPRQSGGASSGIPPRQQGGGYRGSAGQAQFPPIGGSAGRNVAGEMTTEMTTMNDETDDRDPDDRTERPSQRDPMFSRGATYGGYDPGASMGVAPLTPPRLNKRYTFSTFIVGSGNQLAHAASQAVADAPGYAYNPLFLYGGVGLGKTHLLHAIGHTALERNLTVLYVSSETFTNEIVNAILYRKTEEFRAKYRSVDVLLVDDIQFIAGKDSTEEEFFHTFNSLYETNRQIVICSDRPPKAIVSLEERLRSRFEWGLIADIQPPDLETRIAILRAKAELIGHHTPDEVILFVANRVQSNIRELEGSLNRVLAFAELQGLPMSIETAKAAMASLATDTRQRRVSIDDVINLVADYYRIQVDDLKGKQRDKHIVVPRQVAMYLMRQETDASLLEIGQALGGRDHSTVLHGCDKITREVNENTSLRKEVLAIRQQLLG